MSDGFEGAIAGLGLSDVIQLNVHSRFSGCIAVQYQQARGLLFFRDGEIIHAEQGARLGEEAFCDILEWPTGRFSLQPNVATTRNTIKKNWQHLLLDAHRVIDERRAGRGSPTEAAPQRAAQASNANEVIERLRQIPGVAYAVLQLKDGRRTGDDSYEAETLAGQSAYLAIVGKHLGAVFQAGDLASAAVQGTTHHLLLFATRTHYLSILVTGDARVGAVEAEVRRALAGGR